MDGLDSYFYLSTVSISPSIYLSIQLSKVFFSNFLSFILSFVLFLNKSILSYFCLALRLAFAASSAPALEFRPSLVVMISTGVRAEGGELVFTVNDNKLYKSKERLHDR